MKSIRNLSAALAASAIGALMVGLPASAHVSADATTVETGKTGRLVFSIGHGCNASPTNKVAVQIPAGVLGAKPLVLAGWNLETKKTAVDPPQRGAHGKEIDERVSEIIWTATAGNELPSDFLGQFTFTYTAPDKVGERLYFKTVQSCVNGENPWIQETVEGGNEPESPAPFVDVVEADSHTGGHDHGATTTGAKPDDAQAEKPEAASADKAESSDSSEGGSNNIGPYALGAAGVALGVVSLIRSRPTAS